MHGSVTDERLIDDLFDGRHIRYVFHLAAYAAEGLSHFIRRFNYTNNVIGSVNVINAAVRHHVDCFVFTSSIAVYGRVEPPMREEQTPRPEDPYGIAKLAVELDLHAAAQVFDLPFVIFRPHNVFGEYQNLADPYRNVVGIFMNQILSGRPMTIFGDGSQQRAFSYVDDIVPIIAESAWTPAARGGTFNVGADHACTVLDLAHAVAAVMGAPHHPIEHLDPRHEVHTAYSDHSRVRAVFGARDQTPLEEGLRRMASWAKAHGVRAGTAFDHVEIDRELPPNWRALIRPATAAASRT